MEYRPLHITVVSAEGLKDANRYSFSKMDVYAEVSIAGYPQSMKKTFVDKNCGTNPKWNQRIELIVDEPYLAKPGLSLLFLLKNEGTFSGDKEIGSVTVPIHDLYKPDSAEEKVVEYAVITASGKAKGTLRFSYRFGDKFSVDSKPHADQPVAAYPAPAPAPAPYASGSGMGYPPPPQPHAGMGYPPPPQPTGYGYAAYPQTSGGYGYQPPPPGYGYAQPQQAKSKMGMGAGIGLGLGAGLLGGLVVGEIASDVAEAAACDDMGDCDF